MKKILDVNHIKKSYVSGQVIVKAINDISLQINEHDFVSIMGPSASGKTTLLNCIATIDTVDEGSIVFDGQNISTLNETDLAEFRRKNLGFIFQDFNLLDTLTVGENVGLVLAVNHIPAKEIDVRVAQITKQLGVSDILERYPYEISGGQKQRCACARAMVHKPGLILADEPTGALDSHSRKMFLETLKQLNTDMGATILMVTHDIYSAGCADRVLFLSDGCIVNELCREDCNRKSFQNQISEILASLSEGEGK